MVRHIHGPLPSGEAIEAQPAHGCEEIAKDSPPAGKDQVKLQRFAELDNLEVIHATYVSHRFPRHSHNTFSVGLVRDGANVFNCHGATHVAAAGTICLVNSGDVHTGGDAGGFSYSCLYPTPELLQTVGAELADRPLRLPYFRSLVLDDPITFRSLSAAFEALNPSAARLERELRFREAIASVLSHADPAPVVRRLGREPMAVRRAREYLDAHCTENVSLADLASVARLSPFHLARTFRRAVGLPPHTYLIQRRVTHAKALLEVGLTPAAAAATAGFADQAQLTKHVKRVFGVTPGQLARSKIRQDRPAVPR